MQTPIHGDYARQLHGFRQAVIKCMTELELTELKPGFPHEQIIPKATYAPWRKDETFLELCRKIEGHTLVDKYRLYEIYQLAASYSAAEGDFMEVGVWRGGTAAIIGSQSRRFPNAKLWLADTFCGVVNASGNDSIYGGGEHADTTRSEVEALLKRCGVDRYEILVGVFPEETAGLIANQEVKLRFVHIDVDTYVSAMNIFEWVWPRVVAGGFVVFDDYGFWGCEGVTHFVESIRAQNITVIHNLNGHALVPKFHCMAANKESVPEV